MDKDSQYSVVPTIEAELVPTIEVEGKRISVQVTAPSDLQEGFTLNVKVDGKDAVVTVVRCHVRFCSFCVPLSAVPC